MEYLEVDYGRGHEDGSEDIQDQQSVREESIEDRPETCEGARVTFGQLRFGGYLRLSPFVVVALFRFLGRCRGSRRPIRSAERKVSAWETWR